MNDIIRYPYSRPLPLSRAVRAGGFLFLAGVLPVNALGIAVDGDITAQTRAVLDRVATSLLELGAGMNDVVRTTVWLRDLSEYDEFNQEYSKHFMEVFPARTTVQAILNKNAKVEIEVQAWVGNSDPTRVVNL